MVCLSLSLPSFLPAPTNPPPKIRKLTRERREYLYRKSLEGKERERYEKKKKLREALAQGKPIPTELRKEEAELRKEIEFEDSQKALPRNLLDDEYARAGLKDPRILITTSRDPSTRLSQFAKVHKSSPSFQQQNETLHN
jgi:U3 small nucleolar ribonucleoprotein protein IMP4